MENECGILLDSGKQVLGERPTCFSVTLSALNWPGIELLSRGKTCVSAVIYTGVGRVSYVTLFST